MITQIKNAGIMGSNQPASLKMILAHPKDIAPIKLEDFAKEFASAYNN